MAILRRVVDLVESVELGRRDTWEQYFMAQAYITSLRSTCGSRRVGSVIVNSLEPGKRRLLATGYNNNPAGDKECINGGCPRFKARQEGLLQSGDYTDQYPCYAVHSEANALSQMSKQGTSTDGCILFTTTFPCRQCAQRILECGISKIYYLEGYPDEFSKHFLEKYQIEFEKVDL